MIVLVVFVLTAFGRAQSDLADPCWREGLRCPPRAAQLVHGGDDPRGPALRGPGFAVPGVRAEVPLWFD